MQQKLPKIFPVIRFQQDLVNWYHDSHRSLPWRETKNSYYIWIAEIMLQQTQVKTVNQYFSRFIERFPTVENLASASVEEVLKYWEGLGYYNRAIKLHQTAQIVKNEFQGRFPDNYQQLLNLPGIGPYTAGAIASFAFNLPETAIDGNVSRVVSRIFLITADNSKAGTKQKIRQFVLKIMPREKIGIFNQALMELGATICTPRRPECFGCPVYYNCKAFLRKKQEVIPILGKKAKPKKISMEIALLLKKNKILLIKRPSRGLLANMWALPATEVEKGNPGGYSIQNILENFYQIKIHQKPVLIGEVNHAFTHRIWLMKLYRFSSFSDGNFASLKEKWVSISQLSDYAVPTAFKKVFSLLSSSQKEITPSHIRKGSFDNTK
jgi:A/G-specific adenine glycosylase